MPWKVVVGTKVVFVWREIKRPSYEVCMCVFIELRRIIPRLPFSCEMIWQGGKAVQEPRFCRVVSVGTCQKQCVYYCTLLPSAPVYSSEVVLYLNRVTVFSIRTESTTDVPTLNLKVYMSLEAFCYWERRCRYLLCIVQYFITL